MLNIFRAKSGHEHFAGSVVFPIHAADGTGWNRRHTITKLEWT